MGRGSDASVIGRPAGWVDFRLGFIPAFDGLRGLFMTVFVIHHGFLVTSGSQTTWFLPGTFLGIDVFFVLSGFLITSLLLEERFRTGRISLRSFYARRALRLLPAVFVLVAVVVLYMVTFSNHRGYGPLWREVWGTLFYYQNWNNAFQVNPLPFYLNHTWSLSVEEQFYVVIPLVMVALIAILPLRRIVPVLLTLAVGSAVWMAYIIQRKEGEWARAYYGTDARAQALLVGVAMAVAVHAGLWLRRDDSGRVARWWGWAGMLFLIAMMFIAEIDRRSMFLGLFFVCSVGIAGFVSEIVRHPEGLMARLASKRPWPQLGEMAYGMYLWHWPIMLAVMEKVHFSQYPQMALQLSLTMVAVVLSYRLVELPVMRRFGPRFVRIDKDLERRYQASLGEGPAPVGRASTTAADGAVSS